MLNAKLSGWKIINIGQSLKIELKSRLKFDIERYMDAWNPFSYPGTNH